MSLSPTPDDATAYRNALGAFATGVCVVTAHTPDGPLGITVNSFTSVSLDPRLILWCLDETSERWPAFAGVDRFAVHVLPADARALSDRFAWGVCALAEGEFDTQGEGPPRLCEALARFDCRTHDRIQMGDHLIVVGAVEAFESREGAALTYFRGRYGHVGEDPS